MLRVKNWKSKKKQVEAIMRPRRLKSEDEKRGNRRAMCRWYPQDYARQYKQAMDVLRNGYATARVVVKV